MKRKLFIISCVFCMIFAGCSQRNSVDLPENNNSSPARIVAGAQLSHIISVDTTCDSCLYTEIELRENLQDLGYIHMTDSLNITAIPSDLIRATFIAMLSHYPELQDSLAHFSDFPSGTYNMASTAYFVVNLPNHHGGIIASADKRVPIKVMASMTNSNLDVRVFDDLYSAVAEPNSPLYCSTFHEFDSLSRRIWYDKWGIPYNDGAMTCLTYKHDYYTIKSCVLVPVDCGPTTTSQYGPLMAPELHWGQNDAWGDKYLQ